MTDFLVEFLKIHPNLPSQALWRAAEAKLLSHVSFVGPILDLGCGDGTFTQVLFADSKEEIHGCDPIYRFLKMAGSRTKYASVTLSLGSQLPYKDDAFATVLCNCVLEHIIQDMEVLLDVRRVLRKGGTFIFTVPSENFVDNLKNQQERYVSSFNKRLQHYHYRSPQEWQKILAQCGFAFETCRYYLPKQVQQLWETLTMVLIRRFFGWELHELLGSRRTGMFFLLRPIIPIIFGNFLEKWYEKGQKDDGRGGGLMITATKMV